jgi:hypothetical protein
MLTGVGVAAMLFIRFAMTETRPETHSLIELAPREPRKLVDAI